MAASKWRQVWRGRCKSLPACTHSDTWMAKNRTVKRWPARCAPHDQSTAPRSHGRLAAITTPSSPTSPTPAHLSDQVPVAKRHGAVEGGLPILCMSWLDCRVTPHHVVRRGRGGPGHTPSLRRSQRRWPGAAIGVTGGVESKVVSATQSANHECSSAMSRPGQRGWLSDVHASNDRTRNEHLPTRRTHAAAQDTRGHCAAHSDCCALPADTRANSPSPPRSERSGQPCSESPRRSARPLAKRSVDPRPLTISRRCMPLASFFLPRWFRRPWSPNHR